jgi:hypothetical protein
MRAYTTKVTGAYVLLRNVSENISLLIQEGEEMRYLYIFTQNFQSEMLGWAAYVDHRNKRSV